MGSGRMLAICVLVLALLACPATGVAETAIVTSDVQITNTADYYEAVPRLGADANSEMVVYSSREYDGNGLGSGRIMCQRLNTDGTAIGPVIQVSDGNTNDLLCDVSGSRIVYTAFDEVYYEIGKIMLYDLATETTTELMSEPNTGVFEARIEGDIVVWTQGQSGETLINYLDLTWPAGTTAVTIGGPTPPCLNVEIGSRYVVWEQLAGDQYDIGGYDILAGNYLSISNDANVDKRQPTTFEDYVVWQATHSDDSMTIEVADMSVVPADRYSAVDNGMQVFGPSIHGNIVSYSARATPTSDMDIYLYRISEKDNFALTTRPDNQYLNNTFGDKVAYVDANGGLLDIWVCTFEFVSDIYVDANAPGPVQDGNSWATAYKHLQDALGEANSVVKPVEIHVAEGSYRPDEDMANPSGTNVRQSTFELINNVSIYGGFPAGGGDWEDRDPDTYITILSGDLYGNDTPGLDPCDLQNDPSRSENSYHIVTGSGTDSNAVLDGFTVTAGNANQNYPSVNSKGGGMYTEYGSPRVANCSFIVNFGYLGGGMYNYHSSPTVTDCALGGNSGLLGGGMHNLSDSNPTVNNCIFNGNLAGDSGGGMHNYTYSYPILTNCTFIANAAHDGGGLSNYGYGSPVVIDCIFIGNTAENGGGMHNRYYCDANITNCIFSGNSANNIGGAIYAWDICVLTVINCTFSQNMALYGTSLACHDPQGYGSPSALDVNNCIFWDSGGEIWNDDGSTITINYSDVQGGYSGMGNIDEDPQFVDANGQDGTAGTADDNLALKSVSPCIDAGDNTAVPAGVTTDVGGRPRIADGDGNITADVDMGAYELVWTSIGDFDGGYDVDFVDSAIFASAWMTEPGDAEWNPDCDISIPADNRIDWRDLEVFGDYWLSQSRFSPIPHLLFSEYVEGSGLNQAVEIYNAGDVEVYLGSCEVRVYNNGSPSPTNIVFLNSVTLSPGEVFVLGHPGISVPGLCDQLEAGLNFSGNDAIELVYQGVPHDVIGQIGFDPGPMGWGSGGITTTDHTLRRKCSVSGGDRLGYDSFDPAVEWDAFAANTFDDLGSHCE